MVADEYFINWRLHSVIYMAGQIDLSPHKIVWKTEPNNLAWTNKVQYHDMSAHALTMKDFIGSDDKLKKWVEAPLDTTILHLGLHDVLNQGLRLPNPKRDYPKIMKNWLAYMIETKRLYLDNEAAFKAWRKSHKFIVYALPDVTDFSGKCLSPEAYKTLRRKANDGLKRKAFEFFSTFRAFIARPKVDNPTFYGMHYTRHHQEVLNRTVVTALAKLFCNKCKIDGFNRDQRESFLEPPGLCQSHYQRELTDNYFQ